MPPKKKAARLPKPPSTPSEGAGDNIREEALTPAKADGPRDAIAPDVWTDDQETVLFKSMIQCKPVGMHKHFSMIQISDKMRARGYNGYISPSYAHTKIPGIWEKLGSLYNLEILDIREDAVGEQFYPFDLPDEPSGDNDGYWDLKFARRIDSAGPSSPPLLPHQLAAVPTLGGKLVGRQSTVEDTDDPRSSPASNTGRGTGRGTRGKRSIRASRLAEVSTVKGRRSQSTDQGTEDDQKTEEEADAMDVDEDDDKASTSKKNSKASKATGKGSTRRSGRKR